METMLIKKISDAAIYAVEKAASLNVSVCLTVVDAGANELYTIRMDDANFMTLEAAYRKAKTSFLFKVPSHILAGIVEKVPKLGAEIEKTPGDAMMIEGGLPLVLDGKIIGGVGVAGGNFEQDLVIVTAFTERLKAVV